MKNQQPRGTREDESVYLISSFISVRNEFRDSNMVHCGRFDTTFVHYMVLFAPKLDLYVSYFSNSEMAQVSTK